MVGKLMCLNCLYMKKLGPIAVVSGLLLLILTKLGMFGRKNEREKLQSELRKLEEKVDVEVRTIRSAALGEIDQLRQKLEDKDIKL